MLLLQAAQDAAAAASGGGFWDYKVLLAFALVVGFLAVMPRLIRKNRQERRLLEKQYIDEVQNRLNVRGEADRIMLELVEAGREINGQLDTKMRMLNKLVKDAHEAIRRLEELGVPAGSAPTNAKPAASSAPLPPAAEPTETTGAGVAPAENEPASSCEATGGSSGSGRWKNDMRRKIAQYMSEGRSEEEIARLTRLSVMEVGLMLEVIRKG